MTSLRRKRFETPCTVELEHSDENLYAHVELAGGVSIGPGDRVRIQGAPIHIGFGERRVVQRIATVEHAGAVARLWTKLAGHFEMTELYDVSFTDRTMK
ncbi:hypothetical protein Q4F19_17680 [Sphingomonas sp. BIUV-7]|uniref:PilZ domain-containing protein n=1 Tax=Sphingomonas natans TaxID=3063330 RepID=A0ABT8YCY4_9SPHN|nr:hypothetical protein [Sphingomonas sp. BIUV-7]MDO6416221.1 hypothetical protein [Sphingomonas sp. BIUV-7]